MSINSKCPCGSGLKYKKCCKPYHDGKIANNALMLMKSRYSAYANRQYKYINDTSNKEEDIESIKNFSNNSKFENLKIIEFIDGKNIASVTFKATIISNGTDSSFCEKSRFIKANNKWLYLDGEII